MKGILRSGSPPSSEAGPGFPHPGEKGSVGPALRGGRGQWGSFCGNGASVAAHGLPLPSSFGFMCGALHIQVQAPTSEIPATDLELGVYPCVCVRGRLCVHGCV